MKQETMVVGGVLAGGALLAYIVSKGGSAHSGVAYAQVDPASVAAVEQGAAAYGNALTQAAVDKAKIASDTILGLEGAKTSLLTAQINASEALGEATIAANAQTQQTLINANAATAQASINTSAQTSQAQIAANATQSAAQVLAQMNESIASTNANAQKTIAANQTTQAQAAAGAQKTSSFWSALGNIASSVLGFFTSKPSSQTPASTALSYSPEVGPAPMPAGMANA